MLRGIARRAARAATARAAPALPEALAAPTRLRSATATASDAPGWMARPETDARAFADDEDDHFPARTPADDDRDHFREGPSVSHWSAWRVDDAGGAGAGAANAFRAVFERLGASSRSPADARYWAYHLLRGSWFLGQGAAGMFAARALSAFDGAARDSSGGGRSGGGALGGGLTDGVAAGARLVAEAARVFEQDLQHINAGTYKAPYDMDPRHRQFDPRFVLDKTMKFMAEATATLRKNDRARASRRGAEAGGPRGATDAADAEEEMTRVWMDSPMYPDYYLKTFHWQTDGWLSSKSAEVYEVSTETLFLGRQDAMQRTALVPLAEWARETGRDVENGAGATLLELACGTGRFLTFVRDNYPEMDVTGLDLSPFYLAEARKNNEYWERFSARDRDAPSAPARLRAAASETLERVGGLARAIGVSLPPLPLPTNEPREADPAGSASSSAGKTLGSASFVQANAEEMPFPDASFDAVTCVYLLHELPPEARSRVAREAARVLKPGGVLVIADSIQLGDRPHVDRHLGRFGDFNEPYYRNYIREELAGVFAEAGLEPWTKELCSSTKVLSFRKQERRG